MIAVPDFCFVVPRSHPDSAEQRTPSVFDINSEDDGSDGGGGAGGRSSTAHKRASNGAASSSRSKKNTKKKAKDPAAVSKAAQATRGNHGEKLRQQQEEEEDEEECVVVDVRNMHGDDDGGDGGGDGNGDDVDDDDEEEEEEDDDKQIVRTTQDVQMEKRMAAIRKDASSVSAPEEEKEEEEEEEEEEQDDEHEEVEGEAGEEEDKGGGGEGAVAGETSRRGAASGSNAGTETGGRKGRGSKAAPPELLTYKAMDPFLKSEGWEIVVGKGLYTWFYLVPGGKGKGGKKGVDYFVSEWEVVQHMRNDQRALARYEAFRKKPAKSAGRRTGDGGASSGAAASRAEGSRSGEKGSGGGDRRRSSSSPTESAARRAKKARGETGAGSHTTAETAAGSAPARQAGGVSGWEGSTQTAARRGEKAGGETNAGSSANAETTAAESASARQGSGSGSRGQRGGRASGRRRAERQPPPPSGRARRHTGIDWEQKWREDWPRLREEGWYWDHGKMGCVYLKQGFTKKTGEVGVSLFESRRAVLEYVFVQESAAAAPAGGGAEGGATGSAPRESAGQGGGGDAGNGTGDGEPVVEWGLAKNRVRRTAADTNSAAPEVMVLPGRGGARKFTRSPSAPAAQGGGASSRQDDGPSAGQGSGSGRPAPRAPGGSKRRRDRGAAAARGAKRGRPAGAKQSAKETGEDARGDPGADPRRGMESDEDAADDNNDDPDNAATQPQFELSSAINLTRLGGGNPAASAAAAVAVSTSTAGKEAATSKLPTPTSTAGKEAATSKLPTPANGSPTASNGGGGLSGSDANDAADSTPKRKSSATSPPGSSSSVQGGGSAQRKKQGSPPTAGNSGVRSSSRRAVVGPFSGLGVVVTGLKGETRDKLKADIEKLGGEIIDILSKTASAADWRKWLIVHASAECVGGRKHPSALTSDYGGAAKSEVGAKPGSADTTRPPKRMIAVATPDSDRTPKFQLAMAAGMPIVHPLYLDACKIMATEVDTAGYLLPLGRSALLGRGLIMPPTKTTRDRPFQGKTILLHMNGTEKKTLDNWVFTFSLAGAKLKVLQQKGGGHRKGAGAGGGAVPAPGLGAAVDASWCALTDALSLLEGGKIFCVVGPKQGDGDAVPAWLSAVQDAAMKAGTPAGSLEWAIQCMAQGRFLIPDAGTCPWFPLGAAGAGGSVVASSGSVDKTSADRGGRRGRGSGRGGGGASKGGSSGVESRPFHVLLSEGKRYVSGDYVFLGEDKEDASKNGGGAAASASAAADAGSRPQVARIISFRRGAGGKVKVAITPLKRGNGEKVLVASGGGDDDEEETVDEEELGARVLGMTSKEMQATQLYSLKDSGIFCLSS